VGKRQVRGNHGGFPFMPLTDDLMSSRGRVSIKDQRNAHRLNPFLRFVKAAFPNSQTANHGRTEVPLQV
jgi:hypothetical protein